jgi:hypothetical protein
MELVEFDLASADEDTITQKLHEVLVDEVYNSGQVGGFDDNVMQIGTREAKFRNFNRKSLKKMPDLHVAMIGRGNVLRSQDGIFIECKPIDRKHTAGVHYCEKGIIRFIRGDYAWAMTTAMMVGYASDGYDIDPKLVDALNKSTSIVTESMPVVCPDSQTILFCDQTFVSRHKRNFQYVETGEQAPSIELRHLWLWPAAEVGVVSVYCPSHDSIGETRGFREVDNGWNTWGALAYIFPNPSARALICDSTVLNHRHHGPAEGREISIPSSVAGAATAVGHTTCILRVSHSTSVKPRQSGSRPERAAGGVRAISRTEL